MKEKNIRIIFFTIILIIIAFSIYYIIKNRTTFGNKENTKKLEEKTDNNIIIGITDFDTINTITSKNQDVQYISKLIYEPLINITEDFRLETGLAKEWAKLDNKTYLITLNEEKTWQNGKNFLASDVEYTINYIKNEDTIYLDNVKNIESIEIVNDYTIKIYLLEEEKDFEYMLCFPIICEDTNIGTGEFKITNINQDEIHLDQKNGQKKITIKIYNDISKLYSAFSKEEIDIITTKNLNYENYIGEIGYNKIKIYDRNFDYLKFNLENKVLSNSEVLQAIQCAINKNEIIYKVYNNQYLQAEFPLQYGSYLYNNNIEYEYNINSAQKLLEDAGWKYNGSYWVKNGQALSLQIVTNEARSEVAKILKENLETLGFKITIKTLGNSYYKNNIDKINYDILLTGNTVSIKPEVKEYLEFDIEEQATKKETYNKIYETFKQKPNFMGLYFDSITILCSKKLKGNFRSNWYNIFYNIDTWYKVKE